MKLTSFIKALGTPADELKALPKGWRDFRGMSPKEMGDISGITMPVLGSNAGIDHDINIEYLNKMYQCHDLVHTCIDLVSSTFALGRLKVKKRQADGTYIYLPEHPLQVLLEQPNSSMTQYDLSQSYVVHKLLYGTCAFILLRKEMHDDSDGIYKCPECRATAKEKCVHILWNKNGGEITQIIPVHLDRLSEKEYNGKTYFMYNYNNILMPVHPNNILTDPNYSPLGSFYGISPTQLIARWLNLDLAITTQISAYFSNNAIPSMILNFKGNAKDYGNDPSGMLKAMKEAWMANFSMSGSNGNPGKGVKAPSFVYGDVTQIKVQDTLKDIVLDPLFYKIESRVAATYKVPPSMFEYGLDYSSQSATVKQQLENFYNQAIAPLLESFKSKIERYVLPSFNDRTLSLEWDLSSMGVASFLINAQDAMVLKQWELGLIERNEARVKLRLSALDTPEGNDLYRITVNDAQNPVGSISGYDNRLKPDPELTDLAGL